MLVERQYHINSIESILSDTYARGKGYPFELFYGWRKTNANCVATYRFKSKDWENIDEMIRYFYKFYEGEKENGNDSQRTY